MTKLADSISFNTEATNYTNICHEIISVCCRAKREHHRKINGAVEKQRTSYTGMMLENVNFVQ